MKTTLGLIAIAIAGVASSPAYGLAEAGAPAAAGNLRHLDEVPPVNTGGMESKPSDAPPGGYEGFADDQWLESDLEDENWRGGGHGGGHGGGGCWPGSWRWPQCRWGGGGGGGGHGGGGCWPGSWRWPQCRWRH